MDILRRPIAPSREACDHIPTQTASPSGSRCEECNSTFNLRLCATCRHIGCCESQAGHARAHALETAHPVIYQMPVDSGFVWCYPDRRYVA